MANIYVNTAGHAKEFDVINVTLLYWPGSRILDNRAAQHDVSVFSKLSADGVLL